MRSSTVTYQYRKDLLNMWMKNKNTEGRNHQFLADGRKAFIVMRLN